MRLNLICFFITLMFSAVAQVSGLNNALKLLLEEENSPGFVADILVEGKMDDILKHESIFGYKVNYYAGNIASISCNIKTIPHLLQNKIIVYAEYINSLKKPLNDTAIYRNRIKGVKLWTAPLNQAYNGEGILMGIIDTGTDFTHPDFKDAFGQTRIKFIWDQAKNSGSGVPQPYNYGIEWTHNQINNGVCTHSDVAQYGHGTHVSGIAAGNGNANGRNEGVASKSELVVVALDFNKVGPTIADAVNYILTRASDLGKPCVINASVGEYYGSHDGTDLEARLIDNMLKAGTDRVMVAAAGNAGGVKYHTKTQVQSGDTLFTWIKRSGNLFYWCYADTQQIRQVKFSVGANRLNYSDVGRIAFKNYNYALAGIKNDTLKNSANKRIGIIKSSASINTKGVYELFLQIIPDSSSLLWRIESTGNGLHHAWNFDFVSSPLPTSTQFPAITRYVVPDTMYSIVSSFQCSEQVITVANYCNVYSYYDVTNTLNNSGFKGGEIAGTSSSGPTRDGRIKPDIAATGNGIFSAMALGLQSLYLANAPSVVAQGSMHVIDGGTSAAAPVVAGLAALYLQAHPGATNAQVRDAIRFCAYSDGYTGTNLPDYRWGFGKLDGKASMNCNEGVYVGLPTNVPKDVNVYPNPFKQSLSIKVGKLPAKLEVYDALGRLLFADAIEAYNYELQEEKLPLNYQGLILIKIADAERIRVVKAIKEY